MGKIMTYCEALRETTAAEIRRDPDVYLIGEDVGRWGNLFGASRGLLKEFGPGRVKDCPISEAALAGCAVGSALMGMRPIAEIMYIDFITISMDQIINHAAKYHQLSNGKVRVPIVFRTQGGVGMRNSSQHSQSLENWFVNIPGLITVMPSTPADMAGLLRSAIRCDDPVLIIEQKALYNTKGEVPEGDYTVPLGMDTIFHFHRFQNQYRLVCFYSVSFFNQYFKNYSGKRRFQFISGTGGRNFWFQYWCFGLYRCSSRRGGINCRFNINCRLKNRSCGVSHKFFNFNLKIHFIYC